MDLADKISKIGYLGDHEREILRSELKRVIESFGPNLIKICAHGSAVTGYRCLKIPGLTYYQFPNGFEKISEGEKAADVDLLVILKQFPNYDPISEKEIILPKEEAIFKVLGSDLLSNRSNPYKRPRPTYSFPDENSLRQLEENYRIVQSFGNFKIDWNVASKNQYELWESKIPDWTKLVLWEKLY